MCLNQEKKDSTWWETEINETAEEKYVQSQLTVYACTLYSLY